MKSRRPQVLYGINCTGQGHISRARTIIPALREYADVEILISGMKQKVDLPFEAHFKHRGLSFVYNKGSIHWQKTLSKNNFLQLIKDIINISLENYDFVISDFEPISSFASRLKKKKCIHMSHQVSFLSNKVPCLELNTLKDKLSYLGMRLHSGQRKLGFHYKKYDAYIVPPLQKIQKPKTIEKHAHYCVYFPAFSKKDIIKTLHQLGNFKFHLFHHNIRYETKNKNISCYPLSQHKFQESLCSAQGYLTHAGFESTAEALCLGIPLLSIPIQKHYEQQSNAIALNSLGVRILNGLDAQAISKWILSKKEAIQIETYSVQDLVKHILHLGSSN